MGGGRGDMLVLGLLASVIVAVIAKWFNGRATMAYSFTGRKMSLKAESRLIAIVLYTALFFASFCTASLVVLAVRH